MLCEKVVLRDFTKFTGKHLYQSFFFTKVAGIKERLQHKCFPVNFVKFLRTPFLTKYLRWLLLKLNELLIKTRSVSRNESNIENVFFALFLKLESVLNTPLNASRIMDRVDPFLSDVPFLYPEKQDKTNGFSTFSVGIEIKLYFKMD